MPSDIFLFLAQGMVNSGRTSRWAKICRGWCVCFLNLLAPKKPPCHSIHKLVNHVWAYRENISKVLKAPFYQCSKLLNPFNIAFTPSNCVEAQAAHDCTGLSCFILCFCTGVSHNNICTSVMFLRTFHASVQKLRMGLVTQVEKKRLHILNF